MRHARLVRDVVRQNVCELMAYLSFYFVEFGEFPNCSISDTYLHDLVTAGYFARYARTLSTSPSPFGKLDAVSFAAGYASHMIADMIGFHTSGGILGRLEFHIHKVFTFHR